MPSTLSNLIRYAVLIAASGFLAAPSFAATATTTFQVTATVTATCGVTATDLAFGAYLFTDVAPKDATSTVTVSCTTGLAYNVGLEAGTGTGATTSNRLMTGPLSATLNYSLYQDSSRLLNWGNTILTDTQAGLGTGANQAYTVYGRIPAGQGTPGVGAYSDTITVTVTF